jgi:dipeptidyl aminopeptidase/acylaminoacyl peptidase
MRRAIHAASGALALALVLTTGIAGAATPAGPRLAVVKETWNPSRITLLTVNPRGKDPMRIAGGQEKYGPLEVGFSRLSWRPDGAEIAFTGGLGSLFLAGADGSGARELNIANAERPVFAPDGRTLAFTRFSPSEREAEIWTIDLLTGVQRQLTPTRGGLTYVGSSFSPDGSTLLATRVDLRRSGRPELVALNLGTGGTTRVIRDGLAPVYSPDASKIAFFREVGKRRFADLFVLDVAGGKLRRLTRTPHKTEIFADWDPSGQRLVFARFPRERFEWANSILQINADGTCETEVLARKRTVFYGVVWQPGPGRGAGRIDC